MKTVQTLGRHSNPRITPAIHAKLRQERLCEAAEAAGQSRSSVAPGAKLA